MHETVGYLIKRAKTAKVRIYDLTHKTRLALSTDPKKRYVPPSSGKIRIRTTEGFGCNEDDSDAFKPMSNSEVYLQSRNFELLPHLLLIITVTS